MTWGGRLITSEIIGKLGGADVDVIPVEGVASGKSGSSEVLATIDVPAGETWLVAAVGQTTTGGSVSTHWPEIHLGDVKITRAPRGTQGLATNATETISLSIRRSISSGSDTFTGHVYTVKM